MFKKPLLVAGALALLTASSSFATPGEEIARAVAVNGVSDISQAHPKQFLRAFTAVALRTQPHDLPDYVIAAISLRSDLSPKIVAVAVKAAINRWEAKPEALRSMIKRIVGAAIAANPHAAISISQAAVAAAPNMRTCVIAAAISAAPGREEAIQSATELRGAAFGFLSSSDNLETAFVFSAVSLSPANISDLRGDATVNSPEQPPSH